MSFFTPPTQSTRLLEPTQLSVQRRIEGEARDFSAEMFTSISENSSTVMLSTNPAAASSSSGPSRSRSKTRKQQQRQARSSPYFYVMETGKEYRPLRSDPRSGKLRRRNGEQDPFSTIPDVPKQRLGVFSLHVNQPADAAVQPSSNTSTKSKPAVEEEIAPTPSHDLPVINSDVQSDHGDQSSNSLDPLTPLETFKEDTFDEQTPNVVIITTPPMNTHPLYESSSNDYQQSLLSASLPASLPIPHTENKLDIPLTHQLTPFPYHAPLPEDTLDSCPFHDMLHGSSFHHGDSIAHQRDGGSAAAIAASAGGALAASSQAQTFLSPHATVDPLQTQSGFLDPNQAFATSGGTPPRLPMPIYPSCNTHHQAPSSSLGASSPKVYGSSPQSLQLSGEIRRIIAVHMPILDVCDCGVIFNTSTKEVTGFVPLTAPAAETTNVSSWSEQSAKRRLLYPLRIPATQPITTPSYPSTSSTEFLNTPYLAPSSFSPAEYSPRTPASSFHNGYPYPPWNRRS